MSMLYCGGKPGQGAAAGSIPGPDVSRIPAGTPGAVTLRCGGETVQLAAGDIIYAEIFGHELHVHTVSGRTYRGRGRLSALGQQLAGCGFLRCHRSYLVQLRHVRCIRRYRITLSDGTELPVSKQNYLAIQRALTAYAAEQQTGLPRTN